MSLNSSDVAHRWANQVPDKRGNLRATASNVSYDGAFLYSYSAIIGIRLDYAGHLPLILLNDKRYSNTTSKHQSWARGAAGHRELRFNIYFYADRSRNYWGKEHLLRDITDGILIPEIEAIEREIKRFNDKTFRLKPGERGEAYEILGKIKLAEELYEALADRSKSIPGKSTEAELLAKAQQGISIARSALDAACEAKGFSLAELPALIAQDIEASNEKKHARYMKKTEKQRAEAVEGIAKWRSGEVRFVSNVGLVVGYDFNCILRVSADGQSIETSMGVRIPIEQAKRIWDIASARGKDASHAIASGIKTTSGTYDVSINGVFHAGCHRVSPDEARAIAEKLGWTNESPVTNQQ